MNFDEDKKIGYSDTLYMIRLINLLILNILSFPEKTKKQYYERYQNILNDFQTEQKAFFF